MNLMTNWGYELTSCDELRDILTASEFNEFTANKFVGDERIISEIKAASAAVRNYCGWHLYPSAECKMTERVLYGNGRIKAVGHDLMIQLPAKFVSAVTSAKIDNVAYTDFTCDANGTLYVFDIDFYKITKKTKIEIEYTAGVSASLVQSIKEIVAHRVNHALSSSNGVASESAGGVSISYNNLWINSSKASSLSDDEKETLSSYKLRGVF